MKSPVRETIVALSSGALPSGVAVIRLSGPQSSVICEVMAGILPQPRVATLRPIRDRNGIVLDRGLALFFPGPNSFTGEDCVELHLHGGKAVVQSALKAATEFENCRLAEAGEFSRRAFENGKLDLVEAEGLADLLAAETEMQRRLALEQSSGHLSAIYQKWREQLLGARALIEAELDFSDEGDIPGSVSDRIWSEMSSLAQEIEQELGNLKAGEIIRDGFTIVIAGPPNAGKSSLLNALANREVAIVTEYAGTTRDILHCELDIGGYAVHLYDTAGVRETSEPVEREGIRRAYRKMEEADLVLSLRDHASSAGEELDIPKGIPVLEVLTKIDLDTDSSPQRSEAILISSQNGLGLDTLRSAILNELKERTNTVSLAIPSRLRHSQHLRDAAEYIWRAVRAETDGLEIRAEFLRWAADTLGRVTGKVDVETLLGKIFSEFCVGK
ncbi:MAG: tRNA uridine-5-carboxymethylaminomethyl(34) synthesis GTPase MnmE [Shinella sp.]|nr:MAG: tRNA uridine-5-carboxymethylaminomethyl(34) synthesis GTPase MnmE [Shinella sp.]